MDIHDIQVKVKFYIYIIERSLQSDFSFEITE